MIKNKYVGYRLQGDKCIVVGDNDAEIEIDAKTLSDLAYSIEYYLDDLIEDI